MRSIWMLPALLLLSGCGVAETGSSAAASAESAAQQAAQAQRAQDKVRRQIDDAYSKAEEQRRAAEADGQ